MAGLLVPATCLRFLNSYIGCRSPHGAMRRRDRGFSPCLSSHLPSGLLNEAYKHCRWCNTHRVGCRVVHSASGLALRERSPGIGTLAGSHTRPKGAQPKLAGLLVPATGLRFLNSYIGCRSPHGAMRRRDRGFSPCLSSHLPSGLLTPCRASPAGPALSYPRLCRC